MTSWESARLHVQSLIARGLAARSVAAEVGLTGASEIWGAIVPRDRPGWYAWLRSSPGAYALDLDAAERIGIGAARLVRARLSIRYYPSPREPAFVSFAPEERAMALEWLDRTGAPRAERAHEMPPAAFVVGALDLLVDAAGATRAACLGAVDRARCRGERTRDVPAWQLAWPLFTSLVALFAQVERRAPTRLVETAQRGFEVIHGADGGVLQLDSEAVSLLDAVVTFAAEGPPSRGELVEACTDPDARVLRGVALDEGQVWRGPGAPPIPRAWFPSGAAPCATVGCCS